MVSIGVMNINPFATEEQLCATSLEVQELFSALIMLPLVHLLNNYSLRAVIKNKV